MTWDETVAENETILLDWYRRITASGHGDISVEVSKSAQRIEIIPKPRIRNDEAQRAFKFRKGGE